LEAKEILYSRLEVLLAAIAALIFVNLAVNHIYGHPDFVDLYSSINLEPFGRYIMAGLLLLSGASLILQKYRKYGAWLGLILMAIFMIFHFTLSLSSYQNLLTKIIIAFLCCIGLLMIMKKNTKK